MVGDPRITTAQAGVILKMTRQRAWNLIGCGELPVYGPRNSARRLKLSDVQQLAVLGEHSSSGVQRWVLAVTNSSGASCRIAASFNRRSPSTRSGASVGAAVL